MAVFRFNATTQQFESYRTAGPAFLNTLSTLNPGDALLVQSTREYAAELTNGAAAASVVRLEPGANFVTYLGAPAPIAEVLGGTSGITAVFIFNAETQQWLSGRPQGPAFLNQVTGLARGTPLFLLMDRSGELRH